MPHRRQIRKHQRFGTAKLPGNVFPPRGLGSGSKVTVTNQGGVKTSGPSGGHRGPKNHVSLKIILQKPKKRNEQCLIKKKHVSEVKNIVFIKGIHLFLL